MKKNIILSYLTLRKVIGILAIIFPFLLIIGGFTGGLTGIEQSLSAYYWTNANILFVSMLVTFSIFLLSYNGYDKKDMILTTVAGLAMLLVAIFPMTGGTNYLFAFVSPGITSAIHYGTATVTFVSLGIMSFFQFTKSGKHEITIAKGKRNKVYKICGIIIFAAIIGMVITMFLPFNLTFILESIVLVAFGISWLVKGEAILKD